MTDRVIHRQFFRFALVGLATNGLLYLGYLLFTGLGAGPKTAMTLLYIAGVCMTFLLNRNWTFGHDGHVPKAFLNYAGLYALGYLINFAMLYMLVDRAEYDHRVVQGAMILILAVFFFLMQKFLVFRRV